MRFAIRCGIFNQPHLSDPCSLIWDDLYFEQTCSNWSAEVLYV